MTDLMLLAERPAESDVTGRDGPGARDNGRDGGRRPRTRLGRRAFGTRARRLAFLDALARSGDPAVAARALGISVFDAYRLRDADAALAAQWHAAIAIAWERVENRLLSELLSEAEAGDGKTGSLRDSKLALAILARRDPVVTRAGGSAGRPVDGAHVARLRRLAAPRLMRRRGPPWLR